MRKVHPKACVRAKEACSDAEAVVLTVWKKSLLPNCNGFTVFDTQGNLVFRLDNYSAANKNHLLLMDAAGTPLLTIRRKRPTDTWVVLEGEGSSKKPLFTAKKHFHGNCLARILRDKKEVAYEMEGSYARRCCAFYDGERRKVVETKMKETVAGGVAFGADIFRLIVQPNMDATLAMAFLVLLDLMFPSSSSSSSSSSPSLPTPQYFFNSLYIIFSSSLLSLFFR
ncbi:hypothetical protein Fmac_015442 [Flemingia macrophylla]|uniref:Protein LURP-one-related 8 n=1 Tax=Flemingia macrophylla TaxID=520843 RepID=A0ABD1MEK0_9FABA